MMKGLDVRWRALTRLAWFRPLALSGLSALAWCGASACGLVPGPPPMIRWFSAAPDHALDGHGAAGEAPPIGALEGAEGEPRPALRLRRVTAARHLGERIAWRHGAEYGFDDLARWTELPDAVIARALERALFESGAFQRDGRAELALDVEVRAFEEVRPAPGAAPRVARVELGLLLSGIGDRALVDRTLAAESPVEGTGGEALAEALRRAIAEVTQAALTLVAGAATRE